MMLFSEEEHLQYMIETLIAQRDDARRWAAFLLVADPKLDAKTILLAAKAVESWGDIPDPEGFEGGG